MNSQLRDIEYFSVVAEHGNVGRAAEALGLSQPALSKSLRRLEKSMQAKLVKRTGKGIELTTVGNALFSQVRRLRLSLDDVTREVSDLSHGRAGHLRVSTGPGFGLYVLSAACATLVKDAPSVTMKVTVMERNASIPTLRQGQLDLVITTLQPFRHEDLTEESLYDEEFVVYASSRHRLVGKKRVTLADLAQERWAVSATDAAAPRHLKQAFQDAGLPPPRITIESASMSLRHQILASSHLVSFTSKRVVRRAAPIYGFAQFNVRELTYTRGIGVFYRKDGYLSPAARRYIEILKTTAKEIAAEKP